MLADAVRDALSAGGPFARTSDRFVQRAGQLDMALAVAEALAGRSVLVAEAGTGTGKTYAYLVPALLAGARLLISTGSRTLQDQLFRRDLPAVMGALGIAPTVALLKGRANYVCHHHLARHLTSGRFESRRDIAILHRIERFAAISDSGDLSEAPGLSEDSPVWRMAGSTRENCLGQDCEYVDKCFVYRARRRAMQADVVVVNHHLFCADLAMRDEGVSELLPHAEAVIFDEAHQLADVATSFFGQALSSRQMTDLARDLMRSGREDAPESADWIALSQGIEAALRDCRLAAGAPGRRDARQLQEAGAEPLMAALRTLDERLADAGRALAAAAERGRDLGRLAIRARLLRRRLAQWMSRIGVALPAGHALDAGSGEHDRGRPPPGPDGAAAPERVDEPAPEGGVDAALACDPQALAAAAAPPGEAGVDPVAGEDADLAIGEAIAWAEIHRQGLTLHLTPLDVAPVFRRQIAARPMSWIFTSATLAAADGFDHFRDALGLDDARCMEVPSPFDYAHHALLYVPEGLPEPANARFAESLADAVAPLLAANGGRAFLLCTTLRMVSALAVSLRAKLAQAEGEAIEWLVQGEHSRAELLERFRAARCPVLIGSASFWEGVDVVGSQLSIVLLDKLPFAPPDDPVVRGRAEAMKRRGEDPFRKMHLPRAAMSLKQGAGRLIRSEDDRGLLVIGDTRLAEKPYGRRLLRALPPFSRTRESGVAQAFVAGMASER